MVGISEIGKNALPFGSKNIAFGSNATPSFGNNVEYHDEFVHHDSSGETVKTVGLIAVVGLAIGSAVALLLRKPKVAAETVEKGVMELQIKEDGILRQLGHGIAFAGRSLRDCVVAAKDGVVGVVKAPFKLAGEGAKYFSGEARHNRNIASLKRRAAERDWAESLGLGIKDVKPAPPGKSGALAHLDGERPLVKKANELTEQARQAEQAWKAKHGLWDRINHFVDVLPFHYNPERRLVTQLNKAAKKARKAACREEMQIQAMARKGIKPGEELPAGFSVDGLNAGVPLSATPAFEAGAGI